MKVFMVYFWKSNYRLTKVHQWVVQHAGKKLVVRGFVINVRTESRSRKRNPHAVLWGRCKSVKVRNKIATIS